MKKFTPKSWSLSAIQSYEACPRAFYLGKIGTLPPQPSWALTEGIRIHNLLEQTLLGSITGIPRELQKFSTEITNLIKHGAVPEEELVMDKKWNFIDNGWRKKEAWWRGKTDARIDNFIVDLKTGRHYPEHEDQANLYSIAIFQKHPEYLETHVEFWHSKTGEVHDYEFKSTDVPLLIDGWSKRVEKLFKETEWKATEHQWCKYCDYKEGCEAYSGK